MYKNPFTPGYEVLSKSGYSFEHNSLSSAASYLITNDFPDYAAMFYSPSEHEFITSIKYGNFEAGYHNLNDIREALAGRATKEAAEEIKKAQREISNKKIKRIEFEDVLLLRKIRRTIFFEEQEEDF